MERKIIRREEVDSTDEIQGMFQSVFDNLYLIHDLIIPLKEEKEKRDADEAAKAAKRAKVEADKKAREEAIENAKRIVEAARIKKELEKQQKEERKKEEAAEAAKLAEAEKILAGKGKVTRNMLVALVLLICTAFVYAADVWTINYDNVSNPESLTNLLINKFANQTADSYTFTPTTTTPPAAEGKVYYNNTSNVLQLYTGSAWVNIDTAGGVTLDGAYDTGGAGVGRAIVADTGAVAISNTDADAAFLLTINASPSSSAASGGIQITNGTNSTQDALEFVNGGTGYDIYGTSGTWTVTKAGVAVLVGASIGTSDLTLSENSEVIKNDTDNEVEFVGSEDFSIGLGSGAGNQIDFTSDSSAVTIDFVDFDTLKGMTAITGDAADFTISTTGDATGEDLIISQAGTGDNQVIIQSTGTANNAIAIQSSKGIDIDSVDDMAITNTASTAADDFVIAQAGAFDASLLLTSAGTGSDAVGISTTATGGAIKITSTGKLDIDSADDMEIDLAGAAGEDILVTNTGGSITLSATEDIEDAIYINSTTGGINITADGAAASDLDLVCTNGSVNITGGEAITTAVVISATGTAGGIDITSLEDIDITTTGAAGEDISITDTGGSVIVTATEDIEDAIYLNASTGGINITADGASAKDLDLACTSGSVNIVAGESAIDSVDIGSTAGGIKIIARSAVSTEDVNIYSLGSSVNVSASEDIADAITLNATTGGIDITADGASAKDLDLTCTNGSVNVIAGENGVDSLCLYSAIGGIKLIASAAGAGEDVNIYALGSSVNISSTEASVDDGVVITSGAGSGIQITSLADIDLLTTGAAGENIALQNNGGSIDFEATESVADAITLHAAGAAGGITVDFNTGNLDITGTGASADILIDCDLFSIDGTGAANLSVTATADAEDLTISQLGSFNASVIISSTGTGADALSLQSATGGLDIDAKDDIIITCASTTTADDFRLIQTGAFDASISLEAAGTGADAIRLQSPAGGLDIDAKDDIVITCASTTTADDLKLIQTGAVDASISMAAAGTGDDAIDIAASAGGVDIDGVKSVTITSTENTSDAVKINATVGGVQIYADAATTGEDIDLYNAGGSIALTATESVSDAIHISATGAAGGVIIDFNTGNFDVTGTGASADILMDGDVISLDGIGASNFTVASDGASDDLTLAVTGATDSHLVVSSTGTTGDAMQLTTTAGGIVITNGGAAGGEDTIIANTTASFRVWANEAVGDSIVLDANNAASGIVLDFGTGNLDITGTGASADILVDGDVISLDGTGASNLTVASDGSADDLTIAVTGATDSHLALSSTGTSADALSIVTSAGGIDITVAGASANEDIDLTSNTSINLSAGETSADQIKLNATGTIAGIAIDLLTTDGGITLNADGAANGDITIDAADQITFTNGSAGGILVSTATKTKKYKVFPISYVGATQCRVGNGGDDAICVGLSAGADDIGTTQGYVLLDDAADYLRFWVPLPYDWVDTGTQADLVLQVNLLEVTSDHSEFNATVKLFEFGNTTAIVSDTLLEAHGTTVAWQDLVTNSAGIGNDTDIDGDDSGYLVEIRPTADTDDVNIYGFRWVYRVGIQATQ